MGKLRLRKDRRRRVGRVSVYKHRRRWWVYYREHGRPVRKAVADDAAAAEQVAAQINLELASSAPTLFSFRPVSVAELQRAFVDYHEHVARSSLATVSRYRTATQHLTTIVMDLMDAGVRPIALDECLDSAGGDWQPALVSAMQPALAKATAVSN